MGLVELIKYIYIDAPLIAQVALISALVFLYGAAISFLLSIFSRVDQLAFNRRKKRLVKIYQRHLTELLFNEESDKDDELLANVRKKYLYNDESKEIMIQILLDQQRNFSGEFNERIRFFYDKLGLKKLSYNKLNSREWYTIAIGLKEFGLLGKPSLQKVVLPYTNHRFFIVRREAQLALVRMQGIKGLVFLDQLNYRLSEWQQLNLFETLTKVSSEEKPELTKYLFSTNTSVISFALKLVGFFKLMGENEQLLAFLDHEERDIRISAVQTIGRLELFQFSKQLVDSYPTQPYEVKLEILKALADIGGADVADFLLEEFKSSQFETSLQAAKALNEINPGKFLELSPQVKNGMQHNNIIHQLVG